MKEHLSPKQVARALRVSESSIKRWCDGGVLKMEKTAGGHRRIAVSEVLRFVRGTDRHLAEPEILGLPSSTGQSDRQLAPAAAEYRRALVAGQGDVCRRIVFDLFIADHSIATIGDRVLASAMHSVGDGWECGDVEVYEERHGCEITARVLHELLRALPAVNDDAPLALGGTLDSDHYAIPTLLVELVIRQAGWRTIQLGSSLPCETIAAAVRRHQPRLTWLSVSHVQSESRFLEHYAHVHAALDATQAIVVGGRALEVELRQQMKYSAYCDTLQHLQEFLKRGIASSQSVRQRTLGPKREF